MLEELDVVVCLVDKPEEGLRAGHYGTVVHQLAPDAVMVEFSDSEGQTYALTTMNSGEVLKLLETPMVDENAPYERDHQQPKSTLAAE
jgi:hypothetical protein